MLTNTPTFVVMYVCVYVFMYVCPEAVSMQQVSSSSVVTNLIGANLCSILSKEEGLNLLWLSQVGKQDVYFMATYNYSRESDRFCCTKSSIKTLVLLQADFQGRIPLAKEPHLHSLAVKYCMRSHFICMLCGSSTLEPMGGYGYAGETSTPGLRFLVFLYNTV